MKELKSSQDQSNTTSETLGRRGASSPIQSGKHNNERTPLEIHAPRLSEGGYSVIPIVHGQKRPGIVNWRQPINLDTTTLSTWVNAGNSGVGIVCGDGVVALDADVLDDAVASQVRVQVEGRLTPSPMIRIGKAPKALYVFRTTDSFRKMMSNKYRSADGGVHQLEVMAEGQQFVAYGDHPDTGLAYTWPVGDLPPVDQLPEVSERQLRELILWFESSVPDDWELIIEGNVDGLESRQETVVDATDLFERMKPPVEGITPDTIRQQLNFIAAHRPGAGSYSYWFRVGQALAHQFDLDEVGYQLFDEFSQHFETYDARECEEKWANQLDWRKFENPVTYASIIRDYQNLKRTIDVATLPVVEGLTSESDAQSYLNLHGFTPDNMSAALKPTQWVIRDFIPLDSIGFLFGPPSSYKSFLAFDAALCIATGEAWHGNELCRPGGVLIVAGEGQGGLAARWAAWSQHNEVALTDAPLVATRQASQIDTPEGLQEVVALGKAMEMAHGVKLNLILVDTMARNTVGDENKAQDVAGVVKAADELRQVFGCAVCFVHHTGKNSENGMRGSSALHGSSDWEYLAEREERGSVRLGCTKTKDAKEPEDRCFRAKEITIEVEGQEKISTLVLEKVDPTQGFEPPPEIRGREEELYDLFLELIRQAGLSVLEGETAVISQRALLDFAIEDGLGKRPTGKRDKAARRKRLNYEVTVLADKGVLVKNGDCLSMPDTERKEASAE